MYDLEHAGPEEEASLLEGLKKGDSSAFTAIYRKFWYPMFQVVYRKTGRREVAEEIVQDIFTRLWRERQTLSVTHLSRYLFSAVRYEVIDHFRKRVMHDDIDDCLQDLVLMEDIGTENTILLNDLMETIDKGLTGLPEKSREIFRLSRFQNWPVSRIARHMDLSEKAVEYHLTKALRHMRWYLSDILVLLLILSDIVAVQ